MSIEEVLQKLKSTRKFNDNQMNQIRIGLEAGLDVSQYADHKFDYYQMEAIRLGLVAALAERNITNEVPDELLTKMNLF